MVAGATSGLAESQSGVGFRDRRPTASAARATTARLPHELASVANRVAAITIRPADMRTTITASSGRKHLQQDHADDHRRDRQRRAAPEDDAARGVDAGADGVGVTLLDDDADVRAGDAGEGGEVAILNERVVVVRVGRDALASPAAKRRSASLATGNAWRLLS